MADEATFTVKVEDVTPPAAGGPAAPLPQVPAVASFKPPVPIVVTAPPPAPLPAQAPASAAIQAPFPIPAVGQAPAIPAVTAANPAMQRALEDMQRATLARETEAARRQIDPRYDAARRDEEVRRAGQEQQRKDQETTQQIVKTGGTALAFSAAAGVKSSPVATGALTGLAVGGPYGAIVGAAIGAVQEFREGMEHQAQRVGNFALAVASFDAPRFAAGIVELTSSIPIVGGAVSKIGMFFLDLSEAVHGTAINLARYSGDLAAQQARFRVADILRDIDRAERFAPDIMKAEEERFKLLQAVKDLQDKLLPPVLRLLTEALPAIKQIVDGIVPIFTALSSIGVDGGTIVRALALLSPITAIPMLIGLIRGDVANINANMEAALRAMDATGSLTQFLQSTLPASAAADWATAQRELNRERDPVAPLFP